MKICDEMNNNCNGLIDMKTMMAMVLETLASDVLKDMLTMRQTVMILIHEAINPNA